jgi:signal transduction histidine kinase/ligand-binding sensor domain-containing protein
MFRLVVRDGRAQTLLNNAVNHQRGFAFVRPAMHWVAISLLAILSQATPALAQYQFESWTADTGLPQNIITGIHQTNDGYLWIATLDGLARFDGVRFTVFSKANTPGIDSNRFTSLYADRQGHLWLGTETGSVTRYTRERFITYTTAHGLPLSFVRGFTADEAGNLWVLTGDKIAQWEPSYERFVEVTAPHLVSGYRPMAWSERGGFWGVDRSGLRRFVGGLWELHPLPVPFLTDAADLAEEQDGTIWVAAPGGRLARIGKRTPAGLLDWTTVWSDAPSKSDPAALQVEWRVPSGGSWTIEISRALDRSLTLATPTRRETVSFSVWFEDREGNLWLGTDGDGLYRVRKQVVTVRSQTHGLVGRNIYPVFQDRAGAVWMGAWSGGLSRLQDGTFTNYTAQNGLAPGGVTALHEDSDGRLWVATHFGLQTFRDGRFTPAPMHVVHQDGAGSFWLGAPSGGTTVNVIHQDRAGAIWLGTDRGLVRYLDGAATVFTTRDGLASDNVRVIVEPTSAGRLWIGGYGGLTRWQDGRFMKWTQSDGLPGSTIRALYEDREGALWIGTYDSGLGRFHEGRFTRYTTRDGLFNDGVFQILEDARGNLWMSSNRGIHRVRKQELNELAAGERTEITSVAYGKGDGMLNVECNGGLWPAGIRARDGTLWFPTQDGVAVIDPASVTTNPRAPTVVIESFLLDREPIAPLAFDRPLRIPPGRGTFEIQYTGLSFANPEHLRFKYALAGLDKEWIDAGTRRTAYYSYVPPGSYTFTVIAANSDGVWNTEGPSLQLVVLPPFYRTWWFVTLMLSGTAVIIVAMWKQRESRLTRAHAAQQAFSRQLIASQEAERKRIAAELHDGLGQRLVIIRNLAMLVNSTVIEGSRERVNEISSEASQAISEVREIAHNLRPFHLDRLGLTKALGTLVRKASGASRISFTAEMDNIDGLFPKDVEINVYRVVQESVNNILKHSAATQARVTARRSAAEVQITVQDNGRGFTSETDDHLLRRDGFGLLGITERVTLLGGRVDLRSAPGQGTTIGLAFDVTKLGPTPTSQQQHGAA